MKNIKVSDEDHKEAKDLHDKSEAITYTITQIAEKQKQLHKMLWDFLKDRYPEAKGRNCKYSFKRQEILLMGKQWEEDDEQL